MTNHEAHIALWDWLSKNPGISKFRWPGFKKFKPIRNDVSHVSTAEVYAQGVHSTGQAGLHVLSVVAYMARTR